jgi:hypothetical protein
MQEFFTSLGEGELAALCAMVVGIVGVIGGIAVGMAAVIASYFRRTRLDEMEVTLKMEMIERGLAAEDIERVLAAKLTDPSSPTPRPLGRKLTPVSQPTPTAR